MALSAQSLEKPRPRRVYYPTSDGKPMAETGIHVENIVQTLTALSNRYRDRVDVYVGANNFFYWEEGNPKARVSPDTYLVFGAARGPRDAYKVWEEGGRIPHVVFEFTSKSTRGEDIRKKFQLYERLGVREYFLFDPTGDYLNPRLQGYRLTNKAYRPIVPEEDRLYSEQLGLELATEGQFLRLYDPVQQEWLPTSMELVQRAEELVQRAEAEKRRAEVEKQRAEIAEAEIARLRAELEALRQQKE
jgi:Uma2 family endonuclease